MDRGDRAQSLPEPAASHRGLRCRERHEVDATTIAAERPHTPSRLPRSANQLPATGQRWLKTNRASKRGTFNQLRQTYRQFIPQTEQERIWFTRSLTSLKQLNDQRRLRLLSNRSGIPTVMWVVLL